MGPEGYTALNNQSISFDIFDNEDGSFYAICPICGANALAWDDIGAAREIMSHIEEEHLIEEY